MYNNFFSFFFIFFVKNFIFFSIGYFIKNISRSKSDNSLFLLIGFCCCIIFSNFFYFFLNFSSSFIFYFFLFFGLIVFLINSYFNKINFVLDFIKIFCLSIPFILLFFLISFINGEQYYVFRGNQYDYFNYLSQAILFKSYNFDFILENQKLISTFYPFENMEKLHLDIRPATSLIFSIFLFSGLEIFLNAFIIKVYIYYLIFLSFLFFLKSSFNHSSNKLIYFISIIFSLSFWSVYVFEIDALSHFYSISLSILVYATLYNMRLAQHKITNNIYFFTISLISIFLIYPEIAVIIFLSILLFIIFDLNFFLLLIKKNIKLILLSVLFFIIFTIPNIQGTYFFILKQSYIGINNVNNFWGYFGAFILGKESVFLDSEIVSNIKNLISSKLPLYNIIEKIKDFQFENNFTYFYLNIIPSLFGFYHLTITKILDENNLIIVLAIFFLNLIIIMKFIQNIILIFNSKYIILRRIILSVFLSLIFVVSLLLNTGAYWGLIKLFFYFSFFIYLILIFEVFFPRKILSNFFQYLLILLILIFPFYKFSNFKNRIELLDTMPSLMKKDLKKDILWSIEDKKIKMCNGILTNENNFFILKYLGIKTWSVNIPFNSQNNISNLERESYNCNIELKDGTFVLTRK